MTATNALDFVTEAARALTPEDRATALRAAETWRDAADRRTYAPRHAFDTLVGVLRAGKVPKSVRRVTFVSAALRGLDPDAPLPEPLEERFASRVAHREEQPTPRPEDAPTADGLAAAVLALTPDAAAFALDVARTWQGLDRLVPSGRSAAARDYLAGQLATLTGYPVLSAHTRDNVRTIATTLTTRSTR